MTHRFTHGIRFRKLGRAIARVFIRSIWSGPYALGSLADVKPPDVRTSVNGRELNFLDYAAKGKPFNILLNDASGILPSSIKVS